MGNETDILIDAHPRIMTREWCGPARDEDGETYAWLAYRGEDEHCTELTDEDILESIKGHTLDMRRVEVQDQVSRVLWGASGAVCRVRNGVVAVYVGGFLKVSDLYRGRSELAAVAELPEVDQLPTALKLCWLHESAGGAGVDHS